MTEKTICRAKNPDTCWKHGSGIKSLTLKSSLDEAQNFLNEYNEAKGYDQIEKRPDAMNHLRELVYLDSDSKNETVQKLFLIVNNDSKEGKELDYTALSKNLVQSKQVLSFEKKYSSTYGSGMDEEKEQVIKSMLGISPIRYTQLLNSNPVVMNAKKQIEAKLPHSESDFIARREHNLKVNEELQTRLFGAKQKSSSKRTRRTQEDDFNLAEAIVEREQQELADNRVVFINDAAQAHAERNYYSIPENSVE